MVGCQSRNDLSLYLEPSVDAMLEPASSTVVGKRLSVWEAKPVIQDYGTSQTRILLGTRAFSRMRGWAESRRHICRAVLGGGRRRKDREGWEEGQLLLAKIAEQEGVVAPVAFARRTLWQERAWMRAE